MSIEFYSHCHTLLRILQNEISMQLSEVAELLAVSEEYAQTVIDQLRKDGLAGGMGWGPISRNNRTSTFPNFYLDKVKEIKETNRTRIYARFGFWIAVISVVWQISEWILGLIGVKG